MSNLALTQTVWNRLFREFGLWLALMKDLRNQSRKFSMKRNRIQIFELNDVNASTSLWTLAGVKIGTNTDEDGNLFVRIADETPGAGQARVSLYRAAGAAGGDLMAQGSAADNGTITLAAQNSSGLSGTVKIPVISASETNDLHRLLVFPDWGLRAPVVWDGTIAQDSDSNKIFLDTLPIAESLLEAAITQVKSGLSSWLNGRWSFLMASGNETPIEHNTTVTAGLVETTYAGTLEDGRVNMVDETSPAAQTVVKVAVTCGAGVFDSQNQGVGAMAAPTVEQWCPNGTLRFACTDSTIGAEKFSVTVVDSVTNVKTKSENELQVGELFSDPIVGIRGALLVRSPSFDAPDNDDFATISDWTFEGENATNTNDGVLYFKTAAGTVDPTKFVTKIYSSSSYASSSLVAQTEEGANNAIVGINARNNSGLTGTGKIGDACAVAQTCTFNLRPFRTINTNGIADKFTVAVTVASRGEFADGIAQAFRYRLNTATSGAETIDDSYVSAGTFPAFEVRDV